VSLIISFSSSTVIFLAINNVLYLMTDKQPNEHHMPMTLN